MERIFSRTSALMALIFVIIVSVWYKETKIDIVRQTQETTRVYASIDYSLSKCTRKPAVIVQVRRIDKAKRSSYHYLDGKADLGMFSITRYNPKIGHSDINCGGDCSHTASWLPLSNDYVGKIVACPRQFLNRTLYIEWYGNVDCKDTGGLIVMAGEVNSRWHISGASRLDIFVGLNEVGEENLEEWNFILWIRHVWLLE